MSEATSTVRNELLAAALKYAQAGYRVLPCAPGGKVPLIQKWNEVATSDPNVIREWWTQWPDANVGILTSGLVVIDLDSGCGPWLTEHSEFLLALTRCGALARTPSGGRHAYFRQPGRPYRCSVGRLAEHIDVRADNGLVVVPPSRTPNGQYAWLEPPPGGPESLPELPAELQEALESLGSSNGRPRERYRAPERVRSGKRNASLTRAAGALRSFGFGYEEILAALREFNQSRCDPPLPISEVETVARSVCNYEPNDALNAWLRAEPDGWGPAAICTAASIEARPVRWLWPSYLPRGCLTVLGGDAGTGKSTLACDLASRLSRGGDWPDGTASQVGRVLIATAEDDLETVAMRLKVAGADLERIRLVPSGVFPSAKPGGLQLLAAELSENPADLIILDTLSDYFAGTDTNSASEVRTALQPLCDLARRFDASVLALHHVRKPDRRAGPITAWQHELLGSTAIRALARSVLVLLPMPGDQVELRLVKSNYSSTTGRPTLVAAKVAASDAVRLEWLSQQEAERASVMNQLRDSQLAEQQRIERDTDWLRGFLADGPRDRSEVITAFQAYTGSSIGATTAENRLVEPRRRLQVVSQRRGKATIWSLPD